MRLLSRVCPCLVLAALLSGCALKEDDSSLRCYSESLPEYYRIHGEDLADALRNASLCPGSLMPRFAAFNLMALHGDSDLAALAYFDDEIAPLGPPSVVWAEAGHLAMQLGDSSRAGRYLHEAVAESDDPVVFAMNVEAKCSEVGSAECKVAARRFLGIIEGTDVSDNPLLSPAYNIAKSALNN